MSYPKIVNAWEKGSGTRLDKDEVAAVATMMDALITAAADETAAAALAVARANKAEAELVALTARVVEAEERSKVVDGELTKLLADQEAMAAAVRAPFPASVEAAMAAKWAKMTQREQIKMGMAVASLFGLDLSDFAAAAVDRVRAEGAAAKPQPTAQERARAMLS